MAKLSISNLFSGLFGKLTVRTKRTSNTFRLGGDSGFQQQPMRVLEARYAPAVVGMMDTSALVNDPAARGTFVTINNGNTTETFAALGNGPGKSSKVEIVDMSGVVRYEFEPFEGRFTGGVYISAGDMDGDGSDEFVVSPDEGGGPRTQLWTVKNGQLIKIADFFGIDDPNFRGGARGAIGDVNGDNRGELVVAAGFGGGPRVAVFDGMSVLAGNPNRLVADYYAYDPNLRNGVFVAVGDTNGDGKGDVLTAAGPGGGPRISVWDGDQITRNRNPMERQTFFSSPNVDLRGGSRVSAYDFDRDGKAEIISAPGKGDTPVVRIHREDGSVLAEKHLPYGLRDGAYPSARVQNGQVTASVGLGLTRETDGVQLFQLLGVQVDPPLTPGNNGGNVPPELRPITITLENNKQVTLNGIGATLGIGFPVTGDGVTVTATSSNINVVTATIGRSGDNYTLSLTATGYGTADVEVVVTDSRGQQVKRVLHITVPTPPNTPPIFPEIPNANIRIGQPASAVVEFDDDGGSNGVTVSVTANNGNIKDLMVSGAGRSRTISLVGNGVGMSVVTVKATDPQGLSFERTFQVNVTGVAPSLADVPSLSMGENEVREADVQVSHPTTPADQLVLTASTSIQGLVNVTVSGTGATRKIRVNSGTTPFNEGTTVTLTVTDPVSGLSATDTFLVTVTKTITAPSIANIGDVTMGSQEERETDLGINHPTTPANQLVVTGSSSNNSLVTVTVSGTGANRKVRINSAATTTGGTATITLTVTDPVGGLSATDTFVVTVTPGTPAPSFGSVSVSLPSTQLPDVNLLQVGQEYTVGFLAARQTSSTSGPPTFFRELRTTVDNAAALNGVTLELWDVVGNQAVRVSTGVVNGNMVTFTMQDVLMVENNQEFQVRVRRTSSTPMGNWKLSLNSVLFVNETGTMLPAGHVALAGNPDFLGARVHNS